MVTESVAPVEFVHEPPNLLVTASLNLPVTSALIDHAAELV